MFVPKLSRPFPAKVVLNLPFCETSLYKKGFTGLDYKCHEISILASAFPPSVEEQMKGN